ncbi:hypothetical protein HON01_05630 [Candidatus Woesearchaeota archaeon]|nr:hypothetical protein [Candidatus Woesearchaeota archaeon]
MYLLTKRVWATILLAFLGLFLFTAILGYFVYLDIQDLQENFIESPKLFIIKDNNNALLGITLTEFDDLEKTSDFVSQSKLNEFSNYLRVKNYAPIKSKKYMLFIFDLEVFDSLPDQIGFENPMGRNLKVDSQNALSDYFTKSFALELLKSQDPSTLILKQQLGDKFDSIPEEMLDSMKAELGINNTNIIKSAIFANLFSNLFELKGPTFILNEYKADNIVIYPEKLIFKIAKNVPLVVLEKVEAKYTS